ncbi:MAG: response regulator [Candidatus Methylomirabilales bacterium]
MSGNYFCPYCMSNMPPVEYREGSRRRMSCRNCGYPIETAALAVDDAPARARPTILCIDDDKLLLGLFVNALEAHDFRPITAADGPSGIELAKKERPDAILVDVMMPGMTGFDVCRALRGDASFRDTPIIVLTALTDPRIEPKALQAGATLAMQKPYETTKLVQTIRKVLSRPAAS